MLKHCGIVLIRNITNKLTQTAGDAAPLKSVRAAAGYLKRYATTAQYMLYKRLLKWNDFNLQSNSLALYHLAS